ncbi:MAG: hypothetical protein GQ529_04995 [Methyloprofundus sp.]|nr:hypothetical protein [Methyloprofundus sp.]
MLNISQWFKYIVVMMVSIMSSSLAAEEAMIKGNAFYLERIALPENAVFEATLEDVSLMDVPAIILGNVVIESFAIPVNFSIHYDSDEIKQGHRYNVRGKITVDERLIFITDTAHPVLTGQEQAELKLRMKRVRSLAE